MGLNEDLVTLFREDEGEFLSGELLAEKIGVSRTTIWNHIRTLQKLGYEFAAQTHLGYRLIRPPDRMLPQEIASRLKTRFLGKSVHYYEEVASTNDVALELAAKGAEEGTVVVAEKQTSGRGRFGRKWFSPPGKNLILSLILRPPFLPGRASQVAITTSVAAAVCLRGLFDLPALIKWPNDIYIRGRKAGGILTELSAELDRIHHIVVGVGINLNMTRDEIPAHLRPNCTSVRIEAGRRCDRIQVAVTLIQELEKRYRGLLKDGFSHIVDEWIALSLSLGQRIEARSEGRLYSGCPAGLDEDGSLLLRLDSGITRRISGGDIRILSGSEVARASSS
jgi:BirA family biotin operon repressor/biotin-[acetyl-CoA-carboxylase] ligase